MLLTANPKQIDALTATRAIAAILVFTHHVAGDVFPYKYFPYIFHVGNVAVGYFFVLSGFVLYISYYDKEITYTDYFKRRLARIMPVYIFALLFSLCLAVSFSGYNLFTVRSAKEILLSMFCLQAFVPSYPLVINFPAWTISVEMFFYALFPFLLFAQKKNIGLFAVLSIVLYTVSQYFVLKYSPLKNSLSENIVDTLYFSPEIHISQFLVGMIGGYLFNKWKSSIPRHWLLPLLVFAFIVFLLAIKPPQINLQAGLIAPLFMVLVLLIASANPKMLNVRPLVFLGEVSYGIYILQNPVYTLLDNVNKRHIHVSNAALFYIALCVLIATASMSYYWIELPLRRWIRGTGK